MVNSVLEYLAAKTKETANASIFYDNSIVFIGSVKGVYSIKMDARIEKRNFINAPSSGKSILAYYIEDKVNKILESVKLPCFTQNSITHKYKSI